MGKKAYMNSVNLLKAMQNSRRVSTCLVLGIETLRSMVKKSHSREQLDSLVGTDVSREG